jgi:hypothetical protein
MNSYSWWRRPAADRLKVLVLQNLVDSYLPNLGQNLVIDP